MWPIISILLPVLLIVLTGFGLRWVKIVNDNIIAGMNVFLFYCCIPALIFVAIVTSPFHELLNWSFILAYTITIVGIFLFTGIIFKVTTKLDAAEVAFAGFAASVSNSALIALPIILGLFGNKGIIPVAITIIIVIVILMPMFTFFIEYSTSKEVKLLKIIYSAVYNTFKNPFVFAAILGIIFAACHVTMPKWIMQFLNYFGNATIPGALFIIGVSLYGVKMHGRITQVIVVTLLDLVIKPAIAIGLALALKMPTFWAVSLVLVCGVPTAKTVFILAEKYKIYEKETAAIIMLTSIVSIITIPLYLKLADVIWPAALQHIH